MVPPQTPQPLALAEGPLGDLAPASLHGPPERVVHDPQFGRRLAELFALWVEAALAFAGVGILDHAHAVPNQFAAIERVAQDSVGTAAMPDDARDPPVARAGMTPPSESGGHTYLKIPVNRI